MIIFRPTAERLRLAISAGSYAEIDQILVEYRGEVESCWKASTPEQRRLIAKEVMRVLGWARRTILASRGHAQHRHAQSVRQSAYASAAVLRSAVNLDA